MALIINNTPEVRKNLTTGSLQNIASSANLENVEMEYTQNGEYTLSPSAGYDGIAEAKITVDIDTDTPYNEGYADGVSDQKEKLTSLNVSANGTYTNADGYDEVIVYVSEPSDMSVSENNVALTTNRTKTLALASNKSWTINNPNNWLDVSPSSGSAGVSLLTVNSSKDGSGSFNIESTDAQESVRLTVSSHSDYFGIESIDDNNVITFKYGPYYENGVNIFYSLDNGSTWTKADTTFGSVSWTLQSGDVILFKADCNKYGDEDYNISGGFYSNGKVNVFGNIMSMIVSENFENAQLEAPYAFAYFFGNSTSTNLKIVSASNLILPNNTTSGCYRNMFSHCNLLEDAPALPAITLSDRCYQAMFYNCTSLTIAPELPAKALATLCYRDMFFSSGIIEAPDLPAKYTQERCYERMFYGCASLTTAPVISAIMLSSSCFYEMFSNCTALATAPSLPVTDLATSCYKSMFYGCTSLTTAPALPATTLETDCYASMFEGCTSLATAPELPATTLNNGVYDRMFYNCTSLTKAPDINISILSGTRCCAEMFRNCTNLNQVKCLASNGGSGNVQNVTYYWLQNVAATGTFIKREGTTWSSDSSGIPSGWTIQTVSA